MMVISMKRTIKMTGFQRNFHGKQVRFLTDSPISIVISRNWVFGVFFCRLTAFMTHLAIVASVLTMAAIAGERRSLWSGSWWRWSWWSWWCWWPTWQSLPLFSPWLQLLERGDHDDQDHDHDDQDSQLGTSLRLNVSRLIGPIGQYGHHKKNTGRGC